MESIHFIRNGWVEEETIHTLGIFTILWAEFELKHCDRFASPKLICERLDGYPQNDQIKMLCENVKNEAQKYIGEYNENTINERFYSTVNKGKEEYKERIRIFWEVDGTNLVGCLLFIERIRNNLLHGEKDIHTLDAQKDMFIAINALLDQI